ncbi:hypothetical protein [Streptomyces sp. NRRL B-24085]|uniref:DUF6891 domain-containing protein n=1 Tax=Streptomyces sp. NRRL B-24085 TaxID=1709476 RepID=UPI0006B371E4|nr:hypothetical protein [Streptomyces sp. NRRL B-24085]
MEIEGGLAVKAETEYGETLVRVSEQELRDLVHRIGESGDRWLVLQRVPDRPDVFAQVWHESGGTYQMEHRESRESFSGTELTQPDAVADALTGWARGEAGWDEGIAWSPVEVDPPEDVPELPDEVREEVEAHVREQLRCGYGTRATLAQAAEEWLADADADADSDADRRPVSAAQARLLVDRLWLERLAEQETWEGPTDPERLTRAFEALNAQGVTARENFTCCRTCGTAEIGAERAEGDRGFVYFHTQCTESAAAGQGLTLLYGGFDGSADTTAAVGREVVAALTAVGLSPQWDGDPGRAIEVRPLTWHRRLVG